MFRSIQSIALLLTTTVSMTAGANLAEAQLSDTINQLRNQTLQRTYQRIGQPSLYGHPDTTEAGPSIENSFCRIGPHFHAKTQSLEIPETLRKADPRLAEGGLILTELPPASTLRAAGLTRGSVLLALNDIVPRTPSDLQARLPEQTGQPLTLDILTNRGTKRVIAKPNDAPFGRQPLNPLPATFEPTPTGSSVEQVAVSNSNGQISIDATLSTEQGSKRIQIEGSRAEVDRQIDALPRSLATQLRSRVGY